MLDTLTFIKPTSLSEQEFLAKVYLYDCAVIDQHGEEYVVEGSDTNLENLRHDFNVIEKNLNTTFYDLYLFIVEDSIHLIKLPHLSLYDAKKYSKQWYAMNEMHDYMLVTEDSTPWYEEPSIVIKDPDWLQKQYDKLVLGVED